MSNALNLQGSLQNMPAVPEQHLDRLLEQHAWSHAAQLLEQPLLSDGWNWPAHIPAFQSDTREPARKHVHHHFGRKKWHALGRKAPENV